MGLSLVVVSVAAVATAPSVSGARVVVAGTAVRVGVGIGVGVRRTRHGLEVVRESINRLCCAHAIAVIDQAEQSEDTCLEHKLDEKGEK